MQLKTTTWTVLIVCIFLLVSACALESNGGEFTENKPRSKAELTIQFYDLQFYHNGGWAFGKDESGQYHLYTVDYDDLTLQKRTPQMTLRPSDHVKYINENRVYVLSKKNKELVLYHTENAGETWTTISDTIMDKEPIILGLDATPDGTLWTLLQENSSNATANNEVWVYAAKNGKFESVAALDYSSDGMKKEIVFSSMQIGWIGAEGLVVESEDSPYIYTSDNEGVSWYLQKLPQLGGEFIFDTSQIQWMDERNGVILMRTDHMIDEYKVSLVLLQTSDGGQSWTDVYKFKLDPNSLSWISDFTHPSKGWITLDRKEVLQSNHTLSKWEIISKISDVTGNLDSQIQDFDFIDEENGWILTKDESRFFRTSNGGKAWKEIYFSLKVD